MLDQRRCQGSLSQRAQLGYRMIDRGQRPSKGALHGLESEGRRAQSDSFVPVLEDESVFPNGIASPRAAVSYVVADHPLQFQRDVLYNVRAVGAAPQTGYESARFADTAAMIAQSRHRLDQRLCKA